MGQVASSASSVAARAGAGMIRRARGLIAVSGRDRASYLQGLLTNDTVALQAGHGCYAAYLTPQGRMITDLVVHELGDLILLVLPPATKDAVLAKLDQFIFAEDVQLGDLSDAFAALSVVGPAAPALVAAAVGLPVETVSALPLHGVHRSTAGDEPVIVRRTADLGLDGVEVIAAHDRLTNIEATLRAAGAADLDDAAAETLRIEAGVPRFGQDMDDETIPLEAGIEDRAISFDKGCYVGQEVIIRVLHRGHGRVARKLVGLQFGDHDAVPAAGTPLQVDGREVGRITSSTRSPLLGRPIALGYVKRDFIDPGTRVSAATGEQADVMSLPFVTP